MNKELLEEAVELDKQINQLEKHLQQVKDWAAEQSSRTAENYLRIVLGGSTPDSPLLREKYLCITPKVIVSTYISALESEIEELKNKFNNL